MIVYLAASYNRKSEIAEYARDVSEYGHEVASSWLLPDNTRDNGDQNNQVDQAENTVPLEAMYFALEDWQNVLRSEVVIAFTEPSKSGAPRGGRHVELGLALAWGKKVVVVGPRENVFCALPQVYHYWNWGEDVLEEIGRSSWTAEGDLYQDIHEVRMHVAARESMCVI